MKRTLINRVLVISGGLTVLTGLFLLVHFESHFAKAVHQIAGLILVIFSIKHVWQNRLALGKAFTNKRSISIVLLLFALSVAVMAATGAHELH